MSVLLRPYRNEDFDLICEIRGLESQEQRDRFIARLIKPGEWVDHYLHLAIDYNGQLVGDLQFRFCDWSMPPGAWEVGLEVAPTFQSKGIGTEALKLATSYAFAHGAHRLQGSTDISNLPMRRVFEKAGWRYEGLLKALFVEDQTPHDYCSFAITTFD